MYKVPAAIHLSRVLAAVIPIRVLAAVTAGTLIGTMPAGRTLIRTGGNSRQHGTRHGTHREAES